MLNINVNPWIQSHGQAGQPGPNVRCTMWCPQAIPCSSFSCLYFISGIPILSSFRCIIFRCSCGYIYTIFKLTCLKSISGSPREENSTPGRQRGMLCVRRRLCQPDLSKPGSCGQFLQSLHADEQLQWGQCPDGPLAQGDVCVAARSKGELVGFIRGKR